MGIGRTWIGVALSGLGALAAGCEPAPTYDEWMAAYVPHGPLEPTSAVAELEQLTVTPYDEMFPSLSPDGSTLLFVSGWFYLDHSIDNADLLGLDPNALSSARTFAGGEGFALSPAWLPNGSAYLYATDAAGSWQLVRTSSPQPDASFSVIVSDDVGRPLHPTVSPDGERVAFSLTEGSPRQVAVANLDGTQLRLLGEGDYPTWSPQGETVVFQRPDHQGRSQLYSVSVGGGERTQLTFGTAASIHPSYDPTGEYLVFGSTRGFEARACKVCCGLWVARADGTELIELVGGDVDADWPMWGSDGWIYFTSNESGDYDIWRLRWRQEGADSERVPASPSGS